MKIRKAVYLRMKFWHKNLLFTGLLLAFSTSLFAQSELTLTDIWNGSYSAKKAGGFRSLNDGENYCNVVSGKEGKMIVRYHFKDGIPNDTVLKAGQASYNGSALKWGSYELSPDEQLILLAVNEEQIYRHSSKAEYYVFHRGNGKITNITSAGKAMYCRFSPDGQKVAYVRDNNLYFFDLKTEKESQLTTDGEKNKLIYGATDWVYEEEFSMDVAFEWSPDSRKIAFYQFDESAVKEYNLTTYGELYPKEESYKYPKAGEVNSKVEILVYDLASKTSRKIDTGTEREYLPRIKWTRDSNLLSIQRSNRLQNKLELLLADVNTGKSTVILKEENNSFIEITDDLFFLENGKEFIWTSSQDGHNHIYLYNMSGKKVKQLTSGNWDVTAYYGFHEATQTCFYQSTEIHPTEREIWSVSLQLKKKLLTPIRGVHNAVFSKGFRYFTDTYSAYGKPFICAVNNYEGKELRKLEENSALTSKLKDLQLQPVDTFSIVNSEGIRLNGWMIKPPQFNPKLKYPVLMHVYGGPGKQTVMNQWQGSDYLYHQLLAKQGYLIVSVDNRGTPGRGVAFGSCIHGRMGELEVKDQLTVANYLKKLDYVDGSRLGIWGWSFGGYMASLLMTKGGGIFKAGIAVAPVTNWRYYDSIYTERYLKTPQENPEGYDNNSPITFASDLQGKFLLVHGSGDDNVHVQNTMDFINSLVKFNKPFELMIYPNRSHGISDAKARLHLYTKMQDFILKNL